METEIVRVLVTQFKQATDTMRSQIQSLNNSPQSIDWTGPSRDEFVSEAQGLMRAIEAQAEAGVMLAGRVEREVDEWEQVTASLSGSGGSGMPVSGGSASTWSQVPSSSLAPFFTLITVAPWLDGLPNWMRDLYRKFFPAPTPVPFPEVVSPVPEEVVPNNTKGSFGDLIDRPAAPATPSGEIQTLPQPAQPDSSSIPSRVGYDVYYEIPPKAQGAVYGGAACLPTSFSMLTDYFHGQNPDNKAVAPDDLVKMLDTGDGTQGKGVTFDKLNDDLSELGYKDTRFFQSDLGGLKDELKAVP
ncbi:MAG: hypothetical protein IPN29_02355 [Saprospiraceae bacterium]|nr:hypothetical protein [Saprospiraceae bacterium]